MKLTEKSQKTKRFWKNYIEHPDFLLNMCMSLRYIRLA